MIASRYEKKNKVFECTYLLAKPKKIYILVVIQRKLFFSTVKLFSTVECQLVVYQASFAPFIE